MNLKDLLTSKIFIGQPLCMKICADILCIIKSDNGEGKEEKRRYRFEWYQGNNKEKMLENGREVG